MNELSKLLVALMMAFILMMPKNSVAQTSTVVFSDDFDSGAGCGTLSPNWTTDDATRAGINTDTANSGNCSLFTRHGVVTVTSSTVDLSGASFATLEAWVPKGDDSFSENPDTNEDLVLEYRDAGGTWIALQTFSATAIANGGITTVNTTLPVAALHAAFQMRWRQTGGSGSDFDYWHVDDLCFSSAPPNIGVDKTSVIISDPVNGTTNPKALPGAIIRYTLAVENTGLGVPDGGSVVVTDELPADTTMFVGNLGGGGSPFIFTDGTGSDATSLSIDFASLGSASDGVIFLDASSSNITPVIDFDGAVRCAALQYE